jgi:hypothetical protein
VLCGSTCFGCLRPFSDVIVYYQAAKVVFLDFSSGGGCYTITPEDGPIRSKHLEQHNTYIKAITFVHQIDYLFHIIPLFLGCFAISFPEPRIWLWEMRHGTRFFPIIYQLVGNFNILSPQCLLDISYLNTCITLIYTRNVIKLNEILFSLIISVSEDFLLVLVFFSLFF